MNLWRNATRELQTVCICKFQSPWHQWDCEICLTFLQLVDIGKLPFPAIMILRITCLWVMSLNLPVKVPKFPKIIYERLLPWLWLTLHALQTLMQAWITGKIFVISVTCLEHSVLPMAIEIFIEKRLEFKFSINHKFLQQLCFTVI